MKKYRIRFNKTRGQPGRGTVDHVWRVFENEKEYLFKNLEIKGKVTSERDANGVDYNIVCLGNMVIDRSTSTAIICGDFGPDLRCPLDGGPLSSVASESFLKARSEPLR